MGLCVFSLCPRFFFIFRQSETINQEPPTPKPAREEEEGQSEASIPARPPGQNGRGVRPRGLLPQSIVISPKSPKKERAEVEEEEAAPIFIYSFMEPFTVKEGCLPVSATRLLLPLLFLLPACQRDPKSCHWQSQGRERTNARSPHQLQKD